MGELILGIALIAAGIFTGWMIWGRNQNNTNNTDVGGGSYNGGADNRDRPEEKVQK